jgi:hypothetical protein
MELRVREIPGPVALLTNLHEPPLAPARLARREDTVQNRAHLGWRGFLRLRDGMPGDHEHNAQREQRDDPAGADH